MSKRSRRLGKKSELRAVEEAIGASLGKSPAGAAETREESAKAQGKESASKATESRPR